VALVAGEHPEPGAADGEVPNIEAERAPDQQHQRRGHRSEVGAVTVLPSVASDASATLPRCAECQRPPAGGTVLASLMPDSNRRTCATAA